MKHYYILLLCFLGFVISCGVKQPVVDLTTNEETGQIFVTTAPVTGASIILDGVATGQVTPDTLKNVSVGSHIVRVFLNGYKTDQDSFVVNVVANQTTVAQFALQKIVTTITLNINSQPSGATIFLDSLNTGKKTPDTLITNPGPHHIRLVKNGFVAKDTTINVEHQEQLTVQMNLAIQQRVLFESFANVSCIPCVPATENLLKFTEEHIDQPFTIIEYFANWPSPNDPFYKVAPKDVDERVTFYSVQTLPTLKLRGATGVDPNNYDEIVTKFNQAIAVQQSQIGISIEKQLADNQLNVTVEVIDLANETANADLRLFVAIAEDSIHYSSPPGSNGLTDFEWVFRGFLTDRKGQVLDRKVFNFQKNWPSAWQYKQSKIIAFIQNIQSKQIIQTGVN